MIKFDVDGARRAGYNDDQIADTLAQKANFDIQGARAAGFKSQDVIARLTTQPAPQPASPVPPTAMADDPGVVGSMVIGAGRTFDRVGKGMKQLYYGATGNDEASAQLKQEAADDDVQYKKLQNQHPFATAVGESIPSMAIPVGTSATLAGTAGKMALASAAPAALEYGDVGQRAANAATAGAGAVVGGVVVPKIAGAAIQGGKNALRSLVGTVTPEAKALAAKAESMGIKVNVAQLGDSKFLKTLSSAIEQMPFTGGAQAASKQRGDFTRAVSKTFGEDVDKITPEVYSSARTRLGQSFDDLAMRNTLRVDDTVMSRLDGILDEARQMADDSTIKAVDSSISRILKQSNASADMTGGKAGANTIIELPGAAYSSIDKKLGEAIKNGGEKGNYLKQVQLALREAMDQSISPADQLAWNQTRTQYKNLKAVRDIVAKDGADGNVQPNMLLNALNGTEAGKEAMAMGTRGQLGDLGRIGKQFVRDSIPNSGTAQRAMAMGLIGGGGFAFGATPEQVVGMMVGGATAGRLANKILTSPKAIAALEKQGMTLKEFVKLSPSRLTQILGGTTGMATAEDMRN